MSRFICTVVFLSTIPALAATKSPSELLKNHHCNEAIASLLQDWKIEEKWIARLSPDAEIEHWSSTDNLGVWVRAQIDKGEAIITRVSPSEKTSVSWDQNSCKPKIGVELRSIPKSQTDIFSDYDLMSTVVQKRQKGFVLLWSPHMPYSVKAIEILTKLSKTKGIHSEILLDPYADLEFAKHVVRKHQFPKTFLRRAVSDELMMRGAFIHFPTMLFFASGKWKSPMIAGLKSESDYIKFSEQYLK